MSKDEATIAEVLREVRKLRREVSSVLHASRAASRVVDLQHEKGWERVVDFSLIRKGGVPAQEVLKRLSSKE